MAAHIIDSAIFRELYGTPEMRAVFDERALIQRWMDTEVALAYAEAELGVIPTYAADAIQRAASAESIDLDQLRKGVGHTLHPIVPLIRLMQQRCANDPRAAPDAGEYIHFGATTQDIMDTAVALQLKNATAIIEDRLSKLDAVLRTLAGAHKHTLMAGRTHGQQALPITFGFKVAVWVDEVRRHSERLQQCKPRVLVGQFGGAVGTLASLVEHGLEIRARMMARLGLVNPAITWHVAHDGFAEFSNLLALIAGTCGKIASEVIALQRSELWEVEEPFNEGKVGSSTMPHKRNPMLCEAIVALARLTFNSARNGFDGLVPDHERDWTFNHMEWAYLPEVCIYADGALALTERVVRDLRVHPGRMRQNLGLLGGLMLSEAVMFALGKHIGKQTAHEVIYECAMRAINEDVPFREVLLHNQNVMQHLAGVEIEALLDPAQYTGLAAIMVEHVLQRK